MLAKLALLLLRMRVKRGGNRLAVIVVVLVVAAVVALFSPAAALQIALSLFGL